MPQTSFRPTTGASRSAGPGSLAWLGWVMRSPFRAALFLDRVVNPATEPRATTPARVTFLAAREES